MLPRTRRQIVSFQVIKAGFMTMIQDYGRYGYAEKGLSQSGAADEHAFCWANHLLDNHFNDAALEICFGGFEIKTLAPTFITATGADLDFKINGVSQPLWQVIKINEGDILSWHGLKKDGGIRAYLAVKGGIQSALIFKSRSVNSRENIGKPLSNGEMIAFDSYSSDIANKIMPAVFLPDYKKKAVLQVLACYQYELFTDQQKAVFFGQGYQIDSASDRIGYRLNGQVMEQVPQQMPSEGISYGSVEITHAGLPIILLKDRPTIGGYPKIGCVFSLDISKLVQRQATSKVCFELISLQDAQKRRREFNAFFGIQ